MEKIAAIVADYEIGMLTKREALHQILQESIEELYGRVETKTISRNGEVILQIDPSMSH